MPLKVNSVIFLLLIYSKTLWLCEGFIPYLLLRSALMLLSLNNALNSLRLLVYRYGKCTSDYYNPFYSLAVVPTIYS
ncbi:hypothetical protein V1520DRAFT_346495 [Lipomyces starkeyi]